MCGSGRVCREGAGEDNYRVVSADMMKLLLPIRRGAGGVEHVLGMRPNQIAIRIGAAGDTGGVGRGLPWGHPFPVG